MYSYMADAGLFRECLTGRRIPVAQEGDNAALEAAYLRARQTPGETLLVQLEGRIVNRPRVEGSGHAQMLVVDRMIDARRGEICEPRVSAPGLENTPWRLVRLGDRAAGAGAGGRAIQVTLVSKERIVQGFSGCNRVTGGYALSGQKLRFGTLASTRMACAEGMDLEAAFLRALESTARWNILGQRLELVDSAGVILARLDARPE
ncbi:MAG: META domain-containing protein [Candidatus Eisenbacteria bacterium]|nr:META domain-containing protein [Candidatus Eisenbacteria bacterium]